MKIVKLWQEDNTGYDTYDSCVVIAESIEDAKTIPPDYEQLIFPDDLPETLRKNKELWVHPTLKETWGWVNNINNIHAEVIGEANGFQRRGVICSSYNAG